MGVGLQVDNAIVTFILFNRGFRSRQIVAQQCQARIDEFDCLAVFKVLFAQTSQVVLLYDGIKHCFGICNAGTFQLHQNHIRLAAGNIYKHIFCYILRRVVITGETDICLYRFPCREIRRFLKGKQAVGSFHIHRECRIFNFSHSFFAGFYGHIGQPLFIYRYFERKPGTDCIGNRRVAFQRHRVTCELELVTQETGAGAI